MREIFTDKQPGDTLGARHINKLNHAARIVARAQPGAFSFGNEYGQGGPVPFVQKTVKITGINNRYVYQCLPLYYDPDETDPLQRWKQNPDEEEYDLDGILMGVELFLDDTLQVYWDPQRGAFMPCWVPYKMRFCRPPEDVDAQSEGAFYFYGGTRQSQTPLFDSYGKTVVRWCWNADAAIDAGTDCLAIHFTMMGLDGYAFEPEPISGESSGSSASDESASTGSGPDPSSRVEYEVVPLQCEASDIISSASS